MTRAKDIILGIVAGALITAALCMRPNDFMKFLAGVFAGGLFACLVLVMLIDYYKKNG